MVLEQLDDSILDADTCEQRGWRCLTCNSFVTPENTTLPRGRSERERRRITDYFITINHRRRVA